MFNRSEFRRYFEEYASDLSKLAKRCKFTDIEDQIKKKFIKGITSNMIKLNLSEAVTYY